MEITLSALLRNLKHLDIDIRFAKAKRAGLFVPPAIATESETVSRMITDHASVSRFGDGEFRWMQGIKNDRYHTFQDNDPELGRRLQTVFESDLPNFLVCVPGILRNMSGYTASNVLSWKRLMVEHGSEWWSIFDPDKQYYDANITRPYIDRLDKVGAKDRFAKFQQVWSGRRVLIVEGEQTLFGVGNDLLANAKSVKRILCPATNAFSRYDQILKTVKDRAGEFDLVLASLGPTATVLAYDLTRQVGVQAIDIGHLDLEYEWCLSGTKKRIPVGNRFVNELPETQKQSYSSLQDPEYLSQVIARI